LFRIFETRSEYVFELELMDAGRGDLASVVQKYGPLSEGHAASIVIQLIIAASICHSRNVIHRDIKLQNVVFPHARVSSGECDEGRFSGRLLLGAPREVVSGPAAEGAEDAYLDEGDEIGIAHSELQQRDRSTNDQLRAAEHKSRCHVPVKLADFGMADTVDAFARLTGRCGTLGYVAPEIILSDGSTNYGYKVDMFSVSIHFAFVLNLFSFPLFFCKAFLICNVPPPLDRMPCFRTTERRGAFPGL
jgi:serine/threonine protein kinase